MDAAEKEKMKQRMRAMDDDPLRPSTPSIESRLPKVDLSQQIEELKKREGGYTAPENEAMWSSLANRLNAQQQAAQRALAGKQAQMGVRGGAGAAQLGRQQQQFAAQRAMAGQELNIKNIDEVSKRLQQRQQMQMQQQMADAARATLALQLEQARLDRESAERIAYENRKSQEKISEDGGCFIIFVTASSFFNHSPAQAREFAELTKTCSKPELVQIYGQNAIKAVDLLNKTRFVRDHVCTDKERRGYYQLSEKIAPFVSKNNMLTSIGIEAIVKPIASIADKNANKISKLLGMGWIKFWGFIATKSPFIRKNGEIV